VKTNLRADDKAVAARRKPRPGQPIRGERWRLGLSLLLSLLIHTLLLSLSFGGQRLGPPGFDFPWRDRRTEVPDLRIVLVPTQGTPGGPAVTSGAAPLPRAAGVQLGAGGAAPTPPVARPPPRGGTAVAIVAAPQPTAEAGSMPDTADAPAPAPAEVPLPLPGDTPDQAALPQIAEPAPIDAQPSDAPTWIVPAVPLAPTSVSAAASSASSPEPAALAPQGAGDVVQERVDPPVPEPTLAVAPPDPPAREAARLPVQQEAARADAARQEAERQDAARVEAARQEAERLEVARQEAARLEAARAEAAQQAAARQETARQEAARQDAAQREASRQESARVEAERLETERLQAARQAAARAETERQEAERQAAARQEASRQETARAETERLDAERQEAARQATAQREAARVEAEQAEVARREAARRAMGRQLDEEATRREAAAAAARLATRSAPASSSARRGRLWGRTDPNAELIQYAEAWARKLQLNMTFEMVREAAKQPHTDPLVTVAIRSDGSVESVTIVMSSGVAEIDEAIRRVVQSQTPYPAFPPALAREFDVIEIRRTWYFDVAIRLY
jgi:TonB family protein